jgi:hypothetical protein
LLEAICTIMPKPIKTINTKETQKIRENEKAMSPAPKTAAATLMLRSRPRI